MKDESLPLQPFEPDWASIKLSALWQKQLVPWLSGWRDQALHAAMRAVPPTERGADSGGSSAPVPSGGWDPEKVRFLLAHARFLTDIVETPERALEEMRALIRNQAEAGDDPIQQEIQDADESTIFRIFQRLRGRR